MFLAGLLLAAGLAGASPAHAEVWCGWSYNFIGWNYTLNYDTGYIDVWPEYQWEYGCYGGYGD